MGDQGLDRRDQGRRAPPDDATRHGEAGGGRTREAGEDHPCRGRVRRRETADRGRHRDRAAAKRAPAPLPADPHGDRRRPQSRHRLPGAARPPLAADPAAPRQERRARGTGKDLILLLVRGDASVDFWTVVLLCIVGALYVLANFGERNSTARVVSLIASASLSALALLLGLLVAGGHLVLYRNGSESLDKFRAAELLAVPLMIAGVLGIVYLWSPVQRAVARLIPIRPGSPVIYLTVVLGLLLVAQQAGAQVQPGTPLTLADLLAQDIPILALSFVGVGIFVRRPPREATERLGLSPPRQNRWWLVAVVGIIAFLAIAYGIERIADKLSPSSQQQVTNA